MNIKQGEKKFRTKTCKSKENSLRPKEEQEKKKMKKELRQRKLLKLT